MLCLALLALAGCERQDPAPTTEPTQPSTETTAATEPTTQPTTEATEPPTVETEPPAPDTKPATALADHTDVILTTMERGAAVDVAGEFDEQYYIVRTVEGFGLMEKRLLRLEGAAPYEQWTGFAHSEALLYGNYHLLPGEEQALAMNTEVQVLEDLAGVYLVQLGDTLGYMEADQVSRDKLIPAPAGGGSADGGDISLMYTLHLDFLSVFVPQEGNAAGGAQVLVDEAEVLLGWYDREETMELVAEAGYTQEKEGFRPVYVDGLVGYVRANLLLEEGTAPFAQWEGYAQSNAPVYSGYYCNGTPLRQLPINTRVTVLCDLEWCYLVSVEGSNCYMAKDQVSETQLTVYSGGGAEWSDPVL